MAEDLGRFSIYFAFSSDASLRFPTKFLENLANDTEPQANSNLFTVSAREVQQVGQGGLLDGFILTTTYLSFRPSSSPAPCPGNVRLYIRKRNPLPREKQRMKRSRFALFLSQQW